MNKLDEKIDLTERCIEMYASLSVENPEWTERQVKQEVASRIGINLRSVAQRLSKNGITELFVRAPTKDAVLDRLATIGFDKENTPNIGKLTIKELEYIYTKFTS